MPSMAAPTLYPVCMETLCKFVHTSDQYYKDAIWLKQTPTPGKFPDPPPGMPNKTVRRAA